MVGIGDADVRRGVCGNVGDNVVVNTAVIGVKAKVYGYVGVKRFKIGDSLLVNVNLRFIRVVFCPKGYLVIPGSVKLFGNFKDLHAL